MLVNDLIEVLLQVMEMELSGLFHIVGVECISKYEFGQRVAHTFDLDASLIEPVPVSQVGLRAPRARNLCLVGTKIESVLGIQLPMVNDGLRRFYALHEEGFRDRVKGLMRRN
jgi:dTDP-4-dehydrorhamnose reductase